MKNIVLVGPMGSGKTTVGRALAMRLGMPFFDSDEVLLAEAGCTMEALLQQFGEAEFRVREAAALKAILAQSPVVLATGGGVVLRSDNRQWLKQRASIIYLAASVSTQMARLSENDDRPLLKVADRQAKLIELNQVRIPYYEEMSDLTIVVDDLSLDNILEAIISRVGQVSI